MSFEKIKELLSSPPLLTMPRSQGLLRLYSDTSRVATGLHCGKYRMVRRD